jgi:hypothetical protein
MMRSRSSQLVMVAVLGLGVLAAGVARADRKQDAILEMQKAQGHLDKSEFDAAIARFNVARSLAPDSSGPLFGLGLAHARAGRCPEAVGFLEEYLRRKTKDPKPEAQTTLESCKSKAPPPAGKLIVTSDPAGAEVRIGDPNAPALGLTPFEKDGFAVGDTKIFVWREGYKPAVRDTHIAAGQNSTVAITLEAVPKNEPVQPVDPSKPIDPVTNPVRPEPAPVTPARPTITPARLILDIEPVAGNILINGVESAKNATHHEQPVVAGTYTVYVDRDGYRAVQADITVATGQSMRKVFPMRPLKRSGMLGLAIPFTLIGIGAGAGAIATFYVANDKLADTDDFKDMKLAQQVLQYTSYACIPLALTGFILYGVLNKGRVSDGPAMQISAAPVRGGGMASLSYRF